MDYIVKWVAHYQVTARRYRRPEKCETKEFKKESDAVKFCEEWDKNHWFSHSWVTRKVIDNRCAADKAASQKANETAARYLAKRFHW